MHEEREDDEYQRSFEIADALGLGPYVQGDDKGSQLDGQLDKRKSVPRWPTFVAEMLRNDPGPPEMLIEDWLVRGELHWVFAPAESAKTWLALVWALDVMRAGGKVAWFDEELGDYVLARRLRALGADPDLIETHLCHIAFGDWTLDDRDIRSHHHLLMELKPELAVYDTATDFMATAGVDENSGPEVTRFVKAYFEAGRQLGVTQVVLDHTGHVARERAVGSRAKGAKAKVQWALATKKKFDPQTVGEIKVTREKNTVGALLPTERTFEVGGGNEEPGAFVWREKASPLAETAGEVTKRTERQQKIRAVLIDCAPSDLSKNQIYQLVGGKRTTTFEEIDFMAHSEIMFPEIQVRPKGQSVRYFYAEPPAESDGDGPTAEEPEPKSKPRKRKPQPKADAAV